MEPSFSPTDAAVRRSQDAVIVSRQVQQILLSAGRRLEAMSCIHGPRFLETWTRVSALKQQAQDLVLKNRIHDDAAAYAVDALQRWILTLDALMERANNDIAHAEAGTPPVLIYKYEVALDGATLLRPVNYVLLKILPPDDIKIPKEILDRKRPYLIVDPRAGHGAGIGGFKLDSQVGVALRDGHPVYFVVFRPHPEPEQTLADVMRAEAAFVKEIARRHPDSPRPIIVGNCQGGWAVAILAAANPDITYLEWRATQLLVGSDRREPNAL